MKRPSWEKYALSIAYTASQRSEDPYKRVGACALSHDNRVLGVSYNGLASGKSVKKSFWNNRNKRRPYILHAEQNLLSLFKRNEAKLIACTLLPCSDCARLISCWNVPTVVYSEQYTRDLGSIDIFKFYNIKLIQIPFYTGN